MNKLILYIACLISAAVVSGQPAIKGAACVVPGVIYQYQVSGAWDSSSTMQVCINGGVIADSAIKSNCTQTGAPLSSVLVKWAGGAGASLTVTSSKGNKTLNLSITAPLQPGTVDTPVKTQSFYDSLSTPAGITCAVSSGGSCSPSYNYQWQRSPDFLRWEDIPGATAQNLLFTVPAQQTFYYRRKVTEADSGTIGYSDIATVNVYPQMLPAGAGN